MSPLWAWCSAPLPVPPAEQAAGGGIFAFPEHLPRAQRAQYGDSASQPRREPGQSTAPLRPGGKLRHGGGTRVLLLQPPGVVGMLQGQQGTKPRSHPRAQHPSEGEKQGEAHPARAQHPSPRGWALMGPALLPELKGGARRPLRFSPRHPHVGFAHPTAPQPRVRTRSGSSRDVNQQREAFPRGAAAP